VFLRETRVLTLSFSIVKLVQQVFGIYLRKVGPVDAGANI
jgi:hypothetical protein